MPALGFEAAMIAPKSKIKVGQYLTMIMSTDEALLAILTSNNSPKPIITSPMIIAEDLLAWPFTFLKTRILIGFRPNYTTWSEISRISPWF